MTRTDAVFSKVALAVTLGMGGASAHAVPIVFDFAGTVTYTTHYVDGQFTQDESLAGQAVVGRITIETDGLVPRTRTDSMGTALSHTDDFFDPADPIASELSIGGVVYDLDLYEGSWGYLSGFDTRVAPCGPNCAPYPDRISLFDQSLQTFSPDAPPPPGNFFGTGLGLTWTDPSHPFDWIDSNVGFEPLDVISALSGLLPEYGYYDEYTDYCANGECTSTAFSTTMFTVNSLTVSTPSVPEPGTLALFAVGLLGGAFARRSAVKGR